MHIELLVVTFHLEGCRSLKEKRRRLSGLKDRLGGTANLAVCESGCQDSHQQAEWSFVAIGTDGKTVSRTLAWVESFLETHVDAEVTDSYREKL